MLTIERKTDNRAVKCVLHKLADIPGGVTVSVANLGGAVLLEGTPLCVGGGGLYNVVKTGKVVTAYPLGATLDIAKGHHFKAGDKIANEAATMYATITAIDKTTHPDKDVVTLASVFPGTLDVGALIILVTATENAAVTHGAVVQGAVASTSATSFNVDKGNKLAVGDFVASTAESGGMTGKQITNIDRGSDLYDTITVGTGIGVALADDEVLVVVTASGGTTAKEFAVPPTITKQPNAIAVAGTTYDVVANSNLFVDAWLMAVVKESQSPYVTAGIKAALKGVIYV